MTCMIKSSFHSLNGSVTLETVSLNLMPNEHQLRTIKRKADRIITECWIEKKKAKRQYVY